MSVGNSDDLRNKNLAHFLVLLHVCVFIVAERKTKVKVGTGAQKSKNRLNKQEKACAVLYTP
jgi:hypothetical protein